MEREELIKLVQQKAEEYKSIVLALESVADDMQTYPGCTVEWAMIKLREIKKRAEKLE